MTFSGRATRSIGAVLLGLVLLAIVAGGLLRAEVSTGLESFLPADDSQSRAYHQVTEEFGGDPVVVLLEATDGNDGLDPARIEPILRLEGALAALDDVAAVYGPTTLLNQVAGQAQDLLTQLVGRRDLEINKAAVRAKEWGGGAAAVKRAQERARTSFDTRYGPLLVGAMPGGMPTLANHNFVSNVVMTETGSIRSQWRFLVPDRRSVAILVRPAEDTSAADAARLVERVHGVLDAAEVEGVDTTVTGVPVLISAISDQAVGEAPRLAGIALLAVGMCLLLATWIRRSRRLAPLAVTALAVAGSVSYLGWTERPVSLGVVAFCSVLLGMGCYYPTYFAMGARRRTVLVVATASAASLATLASSPLPLVRDLGMTLALGIALAAGIGLVLRPWLTAGLSEPDEGPQHTGNLDTEPSRSRGAARIGAVALTIVGAAGWVLLPSLAVDTDVEQFAGGLAEYDDAQHAQQVLGSSGEIDLVLRGDDVLAPEALAWLRDAGDQIVVAHGDAVRPVTSPPALFAFLGRDPSANEIRAAARLLPDYLVDSAVTRDRRTALLSFGVDVADLGRLAEVRDDIASSVPLPPAGYEAELTGLPVVALHAQDLISENRVFSNLIGIVVAGIVLGVGLARRSDALRAMWAAAIATGVGLLLLEVTGTAMNPVTVGLGALTVAVGCEFTVVQAEARRTGSRTLGRAVGIVALTSAAGYLVLISSGLSAVRGFGLLLAAAVVLAAGASWVVVRASVAPARGAVNASDTGAAPVAPASPDHEEPACPVPS